MARKHKSDDLGLKFAIVGRPDGSICAVMVDKKLSLKQVKDDVFAMFGSEHCLVDFVDISPNDLIENGEMALAAMQALMALDWDHHVLMCMMESIVAKVFTAGMKAEPGEFGRKMAKLPH